MKPHVSESEPRDTQIKTTRNGVLMQGPGEGKVRVSGIPNFLITRSQAEELVAKGDATIIEKANS